MEAELDGLLIHEHVLMNRYFKIIKRQSQLTLVEILQ
jgi:hypothetical protein